MKVVSRTATRDKGPDRETTFVKFSEFKAKTKKLGVLKLKFD